MKSLEHQIEVDASLGQVYSVIRDVDLWPTIFPPCKAARIIEQDEQRQLIEITALANDRLMTWRSERELRPKQRLIRFRQVVPSPLLASMEGTWRFYPLSTGTLVVLEHRFAVKEGISSMDETLAFMTRSTDENSRRELMAIKHHLERRERPAGAEPLSIEFEESMLISAPADVVYPLLHRARDWPRLLPHCREVDLRYDDGRNQEFVMTVDVRGREEHIRTIRRCIPDCRITYFQPEPPPLLRRHTGEWRLEPVDGNKVQIVSAHTVELRPDQVSSIWGNVDANVALNRVANAINENSRSTMLAIKERLEA